MEDLFKRAPMVNRLILKNLDNRSIINLKESSKGINQVLEDERVYWIRIMTKYIGNFIEFQKSGRAVISKTPVAIMKELALAIDKFFMVGRKRIKKQWHPLFIAAQQGSLELCKFIVEKTGEFIPKRMEDGITPLDLAAQGGHLKIYRFLVENIEDK